MKINLTIFLLISFSCHTAFSSEKLDFLTINKIYDFGNKKFGVLEKFNHKNPNWVLIRKITFSHSDKTLYMNESYWVNTAQSEYIKEIIKEGYELKPIAKRP